MGAAGSIHEAPVASRAAALAAPAAVPTGGLRDLLALTHYGRGGGMGFTIRGLVGEEGTRVVAFICPREAGRGAVLHGLRQGGARRSGAQWTAGHTWPPA